METFEFLRVGRAAKSAIEGERRSTIRSRARKYIFYGVTFAAVTLAHRSARMFAQRVAARQGTAAESVSLIGAKGIAVLPLFPIFRHFFHFHENPSSSVISGTFSRENRFRQKRQKRPKIAKHTKHEPLPKRDALFATFP